MYWAIECKDDWSNKKSLFLNVRIVGVYLSMKYKVGMENTKNVSSELLRQKILLFREMYPIKIFIFMNPDNLLRSPSRSWRRIRNSDGKEAEADRYKDHHHHQGDVEIVRLGIGA